MLQIFFKDFLISANLLTDFFEYLITLVYNEVTEIVQGKLFLLNKSQQTTRRSHDDVWAVLCENLFIPLDWKSAKKHGNFDFWQVFWKGLVLMRNLVCKFPCVGNDQDNNLKCTRISGN